MRTFVLLFVLTMPMFVVCSAAHAKASSDRDPSKPVCTHYDDASKSADGGGSSTTATATSTTSALTATSTQTSVKTGGSSSVMHQHNSSPRWQAFLPGMFR